MARVACVVASVLALFGQRILAQEYTTLLVPVAVQDFSGRFGSVWTTEVLLLNTGTTTIQLTPPCQVDPCITVPITPDTPVLVKNLAKDYSGSLWYQIRRADLAQLSVQARLFEASRAGIDFGTAIPIVTGDQLVPDEMHFLNVPNDPRFRITIRVFSYRAEDQAVIRYHSSLGGLGGTLLSEQQVRLTQLHTRGISNGYAEIDPDSVFSATTVPGVDIVVSSVEETPFWSMVSVTNNDTHHVTLITPLRVRPVGETVSK